MTGSDVAQLGMLNHLATELDALWKKHGETSNICRQIWAELADLKRINAELVRSIHARNGLLAEIVNENRERNELLRRAIESESDGADWWKQS